MKPAVALPLGLRVAAGLGLSAFLTFDGPTRVALAYADRLTPLAYGEKLALVGSVLAVALALLTLCHQLGLWVVRGLDLRIGPAERIVLALPLGFLALGWVVMVLGHFGLLSSAIARVFAVLGWLFYCLHRSGGAAECVDLLRSRGAAIREAMVPLLLLSLFALGSFVVALAPQTHGDPLYYHVKIAWLWAQAGSIHPVDWLPMALQSGLAEYLYTFSALLVGERFATLVVCQLLSVAFGVAASAAIVWFIARRLGASCWLAAVCALGSATLPNEGWILTQAKNDGFVLALALASFALFLAYLASGQRRSLVTSLCLAFATLSVKLTGAFYLLPFATAVVLLALVVRPAWLDQPRMARDLGAAVAIALPFALPILLRNYAFVGNPVYPWLGDLFPNTPMHEYVSEHVAGRARQSGSPLEIASAQLYRWWLAKPVLWLAPLLILSRNPARRLLVSVFALAIGVQAAVTGVGHYARFAFFIYAFGATAGMLAAWQLCNRYVKSAEGLRAATVGLLALAVVQGDYRAPFRESSHRSVPFLASRDSFAIDFAQRKPRYAMDRWINENVSDGLIYGVWDNQSLFLDVPQSVAENHDAAAAVHSATTYRQALARMDAHGFTHILMPHGLTHRLAVVFDDPEMERDFELLQTVNEYSLFARRF